MHDAYTIGIPLIVIIAGIFFNRADFQSLRSELKDLRTEVRSALKDMRSEIGTLRSEINGLRDSVHADMRPLNDIA
jgi:hypothetical protein